MTESGAVAGGDLEMERRQLRLELRGRDQPLEVGERYNPRDPFDDASL
jgi:hypothetical protein